MIINIVFVYYIISILKFVINKLKFISWKTQLKNQKKSRDILTSKPKETKKIISEEDIRKRAFEIYQEDVNSSSNELDNWYYAERELTGYYK